MLQWNTAMMQSPIEKQLTGHRSHLLCLVEPQPRRYALLTLDGRIPVRVSFT